MPDEPTQPAPETPPPTTGTGTLTYDQILMLMEAMRRSREMQAALSQKGVVIGQPAGDTSPATDSDMSGPMTDQSYMFNQKRRR